MRNAIKVILKFYSYILRIEYYFLSYISFIRSKLKGTNSKKRLFYLKDIKILKDKLNKINQKRIAIFVAYHSSNKIPKTNINYLKVLNDSLFKIIYVHNGYLEKKVKNKLESLDCYVVCRENIGQDFGAWKDTISFLEENKLINNLDWLLLCNDSNFCIGGENAKLFKDKFTNMLNKQNSEFDFISLNCNFEGLMHYQSYFICLSKLKVSL